MIIFSDIIDNRHLTLKNEILTKLDKSEKIKFTIGYLYLSGLYQITDKLKKLQDVRLLIDSNINRDLMEALVESVAGDEELGEQFETTQLQRPKDQDWINNLVPTVSV